MPRTLAGEDHERGADAEARHRAYIQNAYAAGLMAAQTDPTGVLTLALCASGLIAWPSHHLWLLSYLPLIRARGSASLDAITARIRQQM